MQLRNYLIICLLVIIGCDNDNTEKNKAATQGKEINIRLNRDPRYVNPFFSPSSIGREIYQYIYLPLADYHPESLELNPILITEIPAGNFTTLDNEEVIAYDINLRPEAKWSDGTTVTALDYEYTIKAINHNQSNISAWKPYFQFLKDIKLYKDDPKKVTVYFDKDYMLSKEIALTIQLMPAHILDATKAISSKSLSEIKAKDYISQDSLEIKSLALLNDTPKEKINVIQTGPYTLSSAEMNQYLILDKKEDYWGEKFNENPFLQAHVNKIIFKIVPDELTALTMAKEGKVDLMMMNSSQRFLELKEDSILGKNWTFQVPQLLVYYYMAINNKSKILSDKKVRRALAHLADIEDYIETLEGGLATRTAGHFHPARSYYNDKLSPLKFDVKLANSLLDDAGYIERDGDGVRQKTVYGELRKLEFDILLTGSSLSKNIALLYQEAAKSAGVKINLVAKKMSLIAKENLYDFNYDLAMLRVGMDEAIDDPYGRWHSDNAVPGGLNTIGYSNKQVDEKIEQLRVSRNPMDRDKLYKEIQTLMYEDTPCIFLYCPLNKILISNKFLAETTTKRPGYLANTFLLSQ